METADCGRPRDHRKRDMWKNIPWDVRSRIRSRILAMPESNEKTILTLAFINSLSTTDICYFCIDNGILSRMNKPYSRRRIQQVIKENVPEYNQYQKHTEKNRKRIQHAKIRNAKERTFCGMCGCNKNLELHHMIPLFKGGDDDEANLIWLCSECHDAVTSYQRNKFKYEWYRKDEDNEV